MLKLDLLNMAFGLVHSSVERSTSRHGHLQASAQLLYGLAWSHCMEMGELRTFHGLKPGMWYWFWKFTW